MKVEWLSVPTGSSQTPLPLSHFFEVGVEPYSLEVVEQPWITFITSLKIQDSYEIYCSCTSSQIQSLASLVLKGSEGRCCERPLPEPLKSYCPITVENAILFREMVWLSTRELCMFVHFIFQLFACLEVADPGLTIMECVMGAEAL